jgi:hypothetical protein
VTVSTADAQRAATTYHAIAVALAALALAAVTSEAERALGERT